MATQMTESEFRKLIGKVNNLNYKQISKVVTDIKRNNYCRTPKTADGFDSIFERKKYIELKHMLAKKEIKEFWIQYPINLICNGYFVCVYEMDYIILHNNNKIELLETKGYEMDVWKIKWKMLHAMYHDNPNIILTVDYMDDKKGKKKPPKPKLVPKDYKPQF